MPATVAAVLNAFHAAGCRTVLSGPVGRLAGLHVGSGTALARAARHATPAEWDAACRDMGAHPDHSLRGLFAALWARIDRDTDAALATGNPPPTLDPASNLETS